jgi:hypothetical protein
MTLFNANSALGAYLRRQHSRPGAPKAITATAHKLARSIYGMLKQGAAFVDAGQERHEERFRSLAQDLGYKLVSTQHEP